MHPSKTRSWLEKVTAYTLMFAISVLGFGSPARSGDDPDSVVDAIKTATPIKHVIIIVGENRSFDHLFATYVPKSKSERVLNLLSEGIIHADGSPGPNFAKANQFEIVSAPNGGKFFSSADMANKQLYATLPPPDVNGLQNPPDANLSRPAIPACPLMLNSSSEPGAPVCPSPRVRISASPTSTTSCRDRSS
jgi:phospholipase C